MGVEKVEGGIMIAITITEAIKQLQEIQEKYGDLECWDHLSDSPIVDIEYAIDSICNTHPHASFVCADA